MPSRSVYAPKAVFLGPRFLVGTNRTSRFTASDICSRSACRESCGSAQQGACYRSPAACRGAFAASADPFPGFVSLVRASQQIKAVSDPPLHSRDDLDRNADLKTELAIRAPLIDGNFGKPVRILVPEGRARRPIAEGYQLAQQAAPCNDRAFPVAAIIGTSRTKLRSPKPTATSRLVRRYGKKIAAGTGRR